MRIPHYRQQCHLKKDDFLGLLKNRSVLLQIEGEKDDRRVLNHHRFIINNKHDYDVKLNHSNFLLDFQSYL